MESPFASPDAFARFGLQARLGAALAQPMGLLDPVSWALGPLEPAAVAALARHPALRTPIARALSEAHGTASALALSAGKIEAVARTPEGRLALALVSEPLARVEKAALICAAAALQRQFLGVANKSDRQRLRAAVGPENFVLATQEAPTLHAGLAELGSPAFFRDLFAAPLDEAGLRRRLTEFGFSVLQELVAAIEPGLSALMALRLPAGARSLVMSAAVGTNQKALLRLIRRRMPEWSAIIG